MTPPPSPPPSPPPPNPVATCPAGTFNNGEGTPTSPVCESCDQLLPPCDSCATLTHTRTREPKSLTLARTPTRCDTCDCPDFTNWKQQHGYDVQAACTAACLN